MQTGRAILWVRPASGSEAGLWFDCRVGCARGLPASLTGFWAQPDHLRRSKEAEMIAQEVSSLADRIGALERRLDDVEKVNGRLELAALITARALQEISGHWDAVYEAMRREEERTGDREKRG